MQLDLEQTYCLDPQIHIKKKQRHHNISRESIHKLFNSNDFSILFLEMHIEKN